MYKIRGLNLQFKLMRLLGVLPIEKSCCKVISKGIVNGSLFFLTVNLIQKFVFIAKINPEATFSSKLINVNNYYYQSITLFILLSLSLDAKGLKSLKRDLERNFFSTSSEPVQRIIKESRRKEEMVCMIYGGFNLLVVAVALVSYGVLASNASTPKMAEYLRREGKKDPSKDNLSKVKR